jgi:NADH-quinone oxidoreductase subunit G
MPKPEQRLVTFEIDGREVTAPEGAMLVDGAKYGDVEIPVFCYEPKLGQPVGACRMCLVEIEGMPKLQTACSTPVKDGMVVVTTSDRVKQAQNAIVEFLLVNHPLDCPVCDKGGECPLQDISFGWGAGRSRFIEPKRHFRKPVELSPLVAIDRERCILCYRCVRFSQEVSEDYQLVFVERADHTYVGTHNGHPYVAPFTGNITELCPVGALTSTSYRFRARPWDIEDAGTVCMLCPSQCNVKLTIRDDRKVLRVLARDNQEVDDGWLCDKGRYGFEMFHAPERITSPMVRDGGVLRPVSWERALDEAAKGLDRAGDRTAALAGGEVTNEEGYLLQFLMREVLRSPHLDSRPAGVLDAEQARILARPDLAAAVSDIDWAGTVLVLGTELVEEAPILDLRVRKAARRQGCKVVVATSHPSSLDTNAAATLRFAPGAAEAALAALAGALGGGDGQDLDDLDDLAARAGAARADVQRAARILQETEGPTVVIWGDRIAQGARERQTVARLLQLAGDLELAATEGAGLIEVPSGANGRGLREVGCVPNMKPGLADADERGRSAGQIAEALAEGQLSALLLLQADPLRTHPDRVAWERALENANFVVAFSDFVNQSIEQHAHVVFPAEAYAEKEGTVTHPDGRLQRVRQTIGRAGEVHAQWHVLLALVSRLLDSSPFDSFTGPLLSSHVFDSVPFYAGLSLDEIGGRGVRWQTRDAASKLAAPELPDGDAELDLPPALPDGLHLGTVRVLWASRETDHSPSLRFLSPHQRAEISPADAARVGVATGDEVLVGVNGTRVKASAAVRSSVPEGSVFLMEGTSRENANLLTNGVPQTVELHKP